MILFGVTEVFCFVRHNEREKEFLGFFYYVKTTFGCQAGFIKRSETISSAKESRKLLCDVLITLSETFCLQ